MLLIFSLLYSLTQAEYIMSEYKKSIYIWSGRYYENMI